MNVDIEERLRGALAAQAARVTPERLRPAVPPTALPVRRPASMFARRVGWVAAVLLLVAAAIVTLRPAGSQPQRPPAVVTPSPSGSHNPSPPPSPSPVAPSPAGVLPSPSHAVRSPNIGSSAPSPS